MTHKDEGPLLARRFEPCVEIGEGFIRRLYVGRRPVARTDIGGVITTNALKARYRKAPAANLRNQSERCLSTGEHPTRIAPKSVGKKSLRTAFAVLLRRPASPSRRKASVAFRDAP